MKSREIICPLSLEKVIRRRTLAPENLFTLIQVKLLPDPANRPIVGWYGLDEEQEPNFQAPEQVIFTWHQAMSHNSQKRLEK
ncbi:MAG: hypothetical protein IPP59_00555 [Betaproteobacteria bacterium]|nr:hypothetical protein [Candidatus Dechloromonas phosphorivorans]